MRLNFVKMNPSGNTTVLILDPLPRSMYALVVSQIMKPTSLSAEQVGFVEPSTISAAAARLQMMGGEFCGNASRCFAAWLVERQYPEIIFHEELGSWVVPIEVSGHYGVLNAVVKKDKKDRISVKVPMPVPSWVKQKSFRGLPYDLTLVAFEGIMHVVAWDVPPSEKNFESIREKVYRELGDRPGALGVMFYNEEKQFITPVVFVSQVNSLVWESSCGSGSVAVAASLAERERKSVNSLLLAQPGGIIGVNVKWDNKVREAEIFGDVSIEAEGTVYVHL